MNSVTCISLLTVGDMKKQMQYIKILQLKSKNQENIKTNKDEITMIIKVMVTLEKWC